MKNRNIRVAVIDDGIEVKEFQYVKLVEDLYVGADGIVKERDDFHPINTNHGTICAKIIQKYAKNIEFISLKIFDTIELKAADIQLLSALEWCCSNKIPVVHMSVGTNQFGLFSDFQKIVNKMAQQNQIIAAACDNKGLYTLPAALSNVIGVSARLELKHNEIVPLSKNVKNITCQASAVHKLRTENQIDITTVNCNSYAAPVVTAQVCNILQTDMESDLNVSKVLKLMFNGKNGLAVLYPDFISKAVIINLGKREIPMSLLSFQSQQVVRDIRTLSALSREEVENLVIIPSEQYRQEEDCFLINRSNQMKHLIYLNQLPEKITKVLNNVIYWDTYLYTNLISNSIGSRELKIEIPLVMVTGNSKEKMKLISELQKKFTSEGFRCIGMIDDIMACICNLWYVIPCTDMNDICELLIKYFNVDILICSVERKTVCGELDDLIIILEEGNSEIKQIENKLFLSDRKFEIEQVYQKIIKYYDNNEDLIQ